MLYTVQTSIAFDAICVAVCTHAQICCIQAWCRAPIRSRHARVSWLWQVIEGQITDPFVLNWLDLLCFLLSGLPANGTIAAEVAFMFNEWYRPDSSLEFPKGGSQAMVNALVR